MGNIFDTPAMAAGYARSRPAVHPHILELARQYVQMPLPAGRALDVGCGAGLSTRALQSMARDCLGIDPSETMIRCAAALTPTAKFLVGRAEALPVPAHSMDLMTAAGSLNYADLTRFFAEAARVLVRQGVLIVYDFSQGRSFPDSPSLDAWFSEFLRRYPMPPDSGQEISPESLQRGNSGLRWIGHETFAVGLKLTPDFYLNYLMTETNVAYAIESGAPAQGIRAWCADTLAPVFRGAACEAVFRGYLACMASEA
jgi:SAM-dependent methyltransferase